MFGLNDGLMEKANLSTEVVKMLIRMMAILAVLGFGGVSMAATSKKVAKVQDTTVTTTLEVVAKKVDAKTVAHEKDFKALLDSIDSIDKLQLKSVKKIAKKSSKKRVR